MSSSARKPPRGHLSRTNQPLDPRVQKQLESLKAEVKKLGSGPRPSKQMEIAKASKYIEMMVAPSDSRIARSPSHTPTPVAVAHLRRTYTLSASAADQAFGIYARPTLGHFLSMNGGDVTVPINGLIMQLTLEAAGARYQVFDQLSSAYRSSGFGPIGPNGGWMWSPVAANVDAAVTDSSLRVENYESFAVAYNVIYYYSGGTSNASFSLLPGQSRDFGSMGRVGETFTDLEISAQRCLSGGYGPPGSGTGNFIMTFNNVSSYQQNSLDQPMIGGEWIDHGNSLLAYRVTALTLLASYRGNMLENSGVIAGARVPHDWVPNGGDMYDSITRLNTDWHKNPLVDGAYVWRLPQFLAETQFTDPGKVPDDFTCLVIGGVFGDADASLEIEINAVVEFVTPLQVFQSRAGPDWDDEFEALLREARALPAATCNPSHEKLANLAKKGAQSLLKGAAGAAKFAIKNKALLGAMASAFAHLAL